MSHTVAAPSWEQELRDLIATIPDQENWPHIWYDETSDRLTVILRRNDDRSITHQRILPGIDVLLLDYPESYEEPFTGLELSQGVRALVESLYRKNSGENYAAYRMRHNEKHILTTVARIFRAVLDGYDPTELPIPSLDRINRMFVEEPHLSIHIPL